MLTDNSRILRRTYTRSAPVRPPRIKNRASAPPLEAGVRLRALFAMLLLGSGLAASPTLADEDLRQRVYEEIMATTVGKAPVLGGAQSVGETGYPVIRDQKALAACIRWTPTFQLEGWFGSFGFSSSEGRRVALQNCGYKHKGLNCTCQIVDVNGKLKLKLPEGFVENAEVDRAEGGSD